MSNQSVNEFAETKKEIKLVFSEYQNIRNKCGFSNDDYNHKTIENIAKPFIKGYFTLAVVGKVSSGKSTFINALLGHKNLLPVGHDQTTCGITYIEYGEQPEATITFGDESEKKINSQNISDELKKYVAIPKKYHHLPVNAIDRMILGGFTFEKIWENKKQLEEETLCPEIDKNLLKEFVDSKARKNIVKSVKIKFPFDEELKGWRIIDTPGVGAIGGIEDTTRQLLEKRKENGSREVDSIIFLQKGNETLDQTDTKKFVQNQLDSFSESDKKRLFFVLTHASDDNFLNYKENKLGTIEKYYGKQINTLTFVDSFLYAFLNELKKIDIDLKSFMNDDDDVKINNWDENELDSIRDILLKAKRILKRNGDTVNNETLIRKITEWCNFNVFKQEINLFTKNEISKSTTEFYNLVISDYTNFIKRFQDDNNLLNGDLKGIEKRKAEVIESRKEFSKKVYQASKKISFNEIWSKFNFIDNDITKISTLPNEKTIRTSVTNLFDEVSNVEKEVFSDILNTYKFFLKSNENNDIIINSINFIQIEDEAIHKSKEKYVISPEQTEKGNWTKEDKIIAAKYGTRINKEEKIKNFKATVIKKVRANRDTLKKQLKEKVNNIEKTLTERLDKKIKLEGKRLEILEKKIINSEDNIKKNSELISLIEDVLNNLNQKKK